jgi:non-specific serine/threonine protein kinase
MDRATAVQPAFAVTSANAPAVAEICRRLDGLPLAIELAAERLRVLTPDQIVARLHDRFGLMTSARRALPPRHQTLRALIDWSYDRLSSPEQALLRRLSVFAGGWTLGSAEAVCGGDGINSAHVLDLLTALVDRSLVVADLRGYAAGYRLLETIRDYAAGKLEAAGEAAPIRRRYEDWYLAPAEDPGPDVEGVAQLAEEFDNLRAAFEWRQGGWTRFRGGGAAQRRTAGVLFAAVSGQRGARLPNIS